MKKSLLSVICLMIAVITAVSFSACSSKKPEKIAYSDIGKSAVQNIIDAQYLTFDLNNLEIKSGEAVIGKFKGQVKLRKVTEGYDFAIDADVVFLNSSNNDGSNDPTLTNEFVDVSIFFVDGKSISKIKVYDTANTTGKIADYINFDSLTDEQIESALFYNVDQTYSNAGSLQEMLTSAGLTEYGIALNDVYTVIKSVLTTATQKMEGEVEKNKNGYNYQLNISVDDIVNGIGTILLSNSESSLGEFLGTLMNKTEEELVAIIDELFADGQTVGGFITTLETAIGQPNFVKNTVDSLQATIGLSTEKILNIIKNATGLDLPAQEGQTVYDVIYPTISSLDLETVLADIFGVTSDSSSTSGEEPVNVLEQVKQLVKVYLFGAEDGSVQATTVGELLNIISQKIGFDLSMLTTIESSGSAVNFNLGFDSNSKLNNVTGDVAINILPRVEVAEVEPLLDVNINLDVDINYNALQSSEFDTNAQIVEGSINLTEDKTFVITNKQLENVNYLDCCYWSKDENGGKSYYHFDENLTTDDNGNYIYKDGDTTLLELKQVGENIEITIYSDFNDYISTRNLYNYLFVFGFEDDSTAVVDVQLIQA